jgi:hypothetical protein
VSVKFRLWWVASLLLFLGSTGAPAVQHVFIGAIEAGLVPGVRAVAVSPDGMHVDAATSATITVYERDPATGLLTFVEGSPRTPATWS